MPKNYKQKGVSKRTPLKAQVGAPLSRLNIPNLGFSNTGSNLDISKEILSTRKSLNGKMSSRLTPGGESQGFNFGNAVNSAGQLASVASSLMPQQDKSGLTAGLDSAYDTTANAVAAIPGFGPIISGAMKIGGLVSDGLTAMGVGTDQVTTADKILDSKFLKLTPMGLINSFGAKKSDEFILDTETQEQIGSSYEGTYDKFSNLQADKKFGLFSNKARKNENLKIKDSTAKQSLMSGIADNASDSLFAANNTQQTNLRNQYQLNGGINFSRLGKLGFKVFKLDYTTKFKEGGKMNVIPSGALHARKHTIEIDGITKKGIPVISKKEGGVTQHAEVEVDEIIFTLKVTQKLEELMKDGSDKAKIEAGKLIAEEILRNTEDNTGLIEKVQL